MNRWKRWKRTMQLIFNPTTRQIAAAIRLGIAVGVKRERAAAQQKPYVYIDQAGQKAAQSQIGCYEPPERTTGPVQGIRRRAMTRDLREQPAGTLLHRHIEIEQQQAQVGKLDPDTALLPVTKQPSKPRLHRLYAEPDNTFNAL